MSKEPTLLDCYLAVMAMDPEEREKMAKLLLAFSIEHIQKAIDRMEQKAKAPPASQPEHE